MGDKLYSIRGTEFDGTQWNSYWIANRSWVEDTLNHFLEEPHLIPMTRLLELVDKNDTIYKTHRINQEVADDTYPVL